MSSGLTCDLSGTLEVLARRLAVELAGALVGIALVRDEALSWVAPDGAQLPAVAQADDEPTRRRLHQALQVQGSLIVGPPDRPRDPARDPFRALLIPLRRGDDPVGLLALEAGPGQSWAPERRVEFEALALPLSLVVETAEQLEVARQRAARLDFVDRLNRVLTSTVELDELLERTVETLRRHWGYDVVAIGLVEGDQVVLRAAASKWPLDVPLGHTLPVGQGVTGEVVQQGQGLIVGDVSTQPAYRPVAAPVKSEMCCPLRVGSRVIGFLDAEAEATNVFAGEDLLILQSVADDIAQAVENATNLRRINEFKNEVGAMLVHDLRSPVTVIESALQLLSIHLDKLGLQPVEAPQLVGNAQRYLINAQCACQEMSVLITALLEQQRLESGTVRPRLQACSAGDLLRMVARQVQVVAEARDIELLTQVAESLPVFHCDIDLFSRVMLNLASNALKYTPAGGRVTMSVVEAPMAMTARRLSCADGALFFAVEDTGPGVPAQDRERIFEKFVVVAAREGRKKTASTGLGLAFCRQAVRAHEGSIWVDADWPGGTRFALLMPLHSSKTPLPVLVSDEHSSDES
jgi:signal transduction histidine kinase